MTEEPTTVETPVLLEQTAAPIKFVPQRARFDRDFDMSSRIKLLGVTIATAVTLATTALFLLL